jgi:hypothetical protein
LYTRSVRMILVNEFGRHDVDGSGIVCHDRPEYPITVVALYAAIKAAFFDADRPSVGQARNLVQ